MTGDIAGAGHDNQESSDAGKSQLLTTIEAICREKLALAIAGVDEDLFESGVLDSLTLVQLVFELEQRFNVRLPLGSLDISSLRSVREMANMMASCMPSASGPLMDNCPDGCIANA